MGTLASSSWASAVVTTSMDILSMKAAIMHNAKILDCFNWFVKVLLAGDIIKYRLSAH
jgi:hypothetical protein